MEILRIYVNEGYRKRQFLKSNAWRNGGGTTQVDETERYERNESSPRFMPRLNNQRAGYRRCLDPRGKSVHPSTLFSFSFTFSRRKCAVFLPRFPLTIFLRLMRGKRAISTSFTYMGRVLSLPMLSNELYSCSLFGPDLWYQDILSRQIIYYYYFLFLIRRLVSPPFLLSRI